MWFEIEMLAMHFLSLGRNSSAPTSYESGSTQPQFTINETENVG